MQSGGYIFIGSVTNRIALIKPIKVVSVNGPEKTVIEGGYKIRCACVGNNAILEGFTLRGGRCYYSYFDYVSYGMVFGGGILGSLGKCDFKLVLL